MLRLLRKVQLGPQNRRDLGYGETMKRYNFQLARHGRSNVRSRAFHVLLK